jgi:N-acetylglucosamine-6-phosphate deacetylase
MLTDLQVNGYAGVDFNRPDLSAEDLHHACARLLADGVGRILATVITHDIDRMCANLRRLVELRSADALVEAVVAGIHIEGPFLNRADGYIGAHPVAWAREADPDLALRLVDAAGGLCRILTLAPECDPGLHTTRRLSGQGLVVAAGHCDPTLDELDAAIDAGVSLFTHLGNGCPAQLPRHDNIIQRVLSRAHRLHISFIADGAHVPFFALGNFLRCVPEDRVVIVSDAISAAGLGPGEYTLGDRTVRVGEDLVPRVPGARHLAGSACPLPAMVLRLTETLGVPASVVRKWTVDNPTRLLAGKA